MGGYLSCLRLNPRSRQVRVDLGNTYELHRTFLRAFPSNDEGGPGRVLLRIEPADRASIVRILVQSDKAPHWAAVVDRFPEYFAEPPEWKSFSPGFSVGQRLRFRLRANPTRKVKRENRDGAGHRLAHQTEAAQRDWFARKAVGAGFRPLNLELLDEGMLSGSRHESGPVMKHRSVLFEGIIEVTDPSRFQAAVESGIGSAKAFGFGLLSVAPL